MKKVIKKILYYLALFFYFVFIGYWIDTLIKFWSFFLL